MKFFIFLFFFVYEDSLKDKRKLVIYIEKDFV